MPEQVTSDEKLVFYHSPNSRSGGTLVLTWPNPRAPGGAYVDTCKVSADGRTYNGSNQQRAPIAGWHVAD